MNRKTKKLNTQNNLLDKQIKKENQETFTNMICYLRGADISDYDVEIVRRDLTEMVLSAQERGEDIGSLIGTDYKEFCDEVIRNLTPKTKVQKFLEHLDTCFWALSILLAANILISKDTIMIINNLITGKPVNLEVAISTGTAVSMVLIIVVSNLIVNGITRNALEKESRRRKAAQIIGGAVLALVLLGIVWFGKETLFTVNLFLGCFFAIMLFVGHKVIEAF